MDFAQSAKAEDVSARMWAFMREEDRFNDEFEETHPSILSRFPRRSDGQDDPFPPG